MARYRTRTGKPTAVLWLLVVGLDGALVMSASTGAVVGCVLLVAAAAGLGLLGGGARGLLGGEVRGLLGGEVRGGARGEVRALALVGARARTAIPGSRVSPSVHHRRVRGH